MSDSEYHFETTAIHGGHAGDPHTKSRAVPIYQTTSYTFDDAEHAARLFALQEFGNIYTRIMNPTSDVLEQRIAQLEGGVGALALASGQAATIFSIFNLARAGDHIVASASLYGGTYSAFMHTVPKFGIEITLVDPSKPENFKNAIRENTKALFAESIGNPKVDVLDVEAVGEVARDAKIPLIVDSTLTTPYLMRPFEWGANIIVHSATKFIGGHGTSIGGLLVDGGNFDWAGSGNFPNWSSRIRRTTACATSRRSATWHTSSRRACRCCAISAPRSRPMPSGVKKPVSATPRPRPHNVFSLNVGVGERPGAS